MKVLQFAFGDLDDNDLLPHHFHTSNCICYTGTHDNATTVGWYFEDLNPKKQDRLRRYLNTDARAIHMDMIRAAMSVLRNTVFSNSRRTWLWQRLPYEYSIRCLWKLGIPFPPKPFKR